jgi:hypothetical protein
MKQYTTPEQTAKLIELGFDKPFRNEYLHIVEEYGYAVNKERNFSIGELLEMLPKGIGDDYLDISSPFGEDDGWFVAYGRQVYDEWEGLYTFINKELIDAFYDMIVLLKEMGVI